MTGTRDHCEIFARRAPTSALTQVESWTRTGNSRLLVGPTVSLPLLDVGRVREGVGVAQAAQQEAQARYTATVLRALEETDFLQVLDAQRTMLGAETQLTAARTSAGTALVTLYRSTGGSWSMP